ncbi:hypothetical protein D1871_14035 [Nakamurella silvestris]|nr:hypothetical protein D1871_14035 [Nakamurella silvestris]
MSHPVEDGVRRLPSAGGPALARALRTSLKGVPTRRLDSRTLLLLGCASDLSASSRELAAAVENDAEARRLAPGRSNLVRLLDIPTTARVLEIGAGAGAVTRYLGETCAEVDAVEPDPLLALAAARRCADLSGVRIYQGDWDGPLGVPPTPGTDGPRSGYDLILFAPDWADFDGLSPFDRRGATRFQQGLGRLAELLATDGLLVLALPGLTPGSAARRRKALAELFELAGLEVEQSLVAGPDHVRTRVLGADTLAEAAPQAAARFAVGTGSVVTVARRNGAATGAGLFDDHLRSTTVDGRRRQAGRLTIAGPPGDAVVIRQVERLDRPGSIRVNGGAGPWFDGPLLSELLSVLLSEPLTARRTVPVAGPVGVDTPAHELLLRRWADLVATHDSTDGVQVNLIPRHLGVDDGQLVPLGADVLADDWEPADVLARGLLDLGPAATGNDSGVLDTWAELLGLPDHWRRRAVEREAELTAAIHGT